MTRFFTYVSSIKWKPKSAISNEDRKKINDILSPSHYIVLTRRGGHLTTYLIQLAHLVLRFKWGHYSHTLMNVEKEVSTVDDFRFIESVGGGVKNSSFDEVFDADVTSVAILKPKNMTEDEWLFALEKAKAELGKPYDSLFNIANDNALSCVELIWTALKNEPNYSTDFAEFDRMIKSSKNLDPQMFYECPDFEVVYEVRY